jgi:signal transduction histidine kinase
MFRPLADKKNIELRSQHDPSLPPLRQDPMKLRQILSNLLSNAVKFTPEGGRVLLKTELDGDHAVVRVIDTGVGISPEDQELVFEKFRQSANPLTREHAGTGLGLSIVRELTRLLGGEVSLKSELGRGSTFTVRLPITLRAEPRLDLGGDEPRPFAAVAAAARDLTSVGANGDAGAVPAAAAEVKPEP